MCIKKQVKMDEALTVTKRSNEDGYSLLEILVVLAIMAVLASVVAPRLFTQVDKAKITATKAQVKALRLALDSYRLDLGRYPAADEGLEVLVTRPSSGSVWFGPYIDGELPADPWGNPYLYVPPNSDENGFSLSPVVISLGSDGAEGGSGNASDISSFSSK